MKILDKFFSRAVKKKEPEDLMEITRDVGPLIEKAVNDIFALHKLELLAEPISYIVPALWGAKKEGDLTVTQKEIHKQVGPVIQEVFDSLQLRDLSEAQEFAVLYLIRGLIIAKITYMIESVKRLTADLDPLGSA